MLRKLWKKWLRVSEIVGNVVARVVLTVFYFVLFLIPAIVLTFFHDKVGKSFTDGSYYVDELTKLEELDEGKEM